MNKLKALTIIEIVVTLAISTFIVMIAIMAYFVVNNQFSRYKDLNSELQSMYELHFLLQKDFEEADSLIQKNNSFLEIHENSTIVTYDFQKNYVFRQTVNITDSIPVTIELENESVFESSNLNYQYQIDPKFSKESWKIMNSLKTSSFIKLQQPDK